MSKNLKKILVAGASLLMMASIGAGVNQMTQPVHAHRRASADYYGYDHTGTLRHGVTINGHYWRKGTKLYGGHGGNAFSLPDGTVPSKYDSWSYMGNPFGPQELVPAWAMRKGPVHHHYRHHAKALYQIRPHYSTKTYNRLMKRLTREMKAHGAHFNKSMVTLTLRHNGRMLELTGTNTGVVTNGGAMGIKPLWPDQALKLLHTMYGHKSAYRRVRRSVCKRARKPRRIAKKATHKARKAVKKSARRTARKSRSKAVSPYEPKRVSRKTSKYYHNAWSQALKTNQKGLAFDLKLAKQDAKNGNAKGSKKAMQKADMMKGFVKHDQTMINLSK